jgi:hypothetical protein
MRLEFDLQVERRLDEPRQCRGHDLDLGTGRGAAALDAIRIVGIAGLLLGHELDGIRRRDAREKNANARYSGCDARHRRSHGRLSGDGPLQ